MKVCNELINYILNIKKKKEISFLEPVSEKIIFDFESKYGEIPLELKKLYSITNGISYEEFRILPFFDARNSKKTWDSIERANNYSKTKFSLPSKEFLEDFLIFSEIGGMNIAAYNKKDQSIWYEDEEGYHRTNINIISFIKGMIKELSEE